MIETTGSYALRDHSVRPMGWPQRASASCGSPGTRIVAEEIGPGGSAFNLARLMERVPRGTNPGREARS